MSADQVTRTLIDLISQLPVELRPQIGAMLGQAAASQHTWTGPVVVGLAVVVIAIVRAVVDRVH